MSKRILILEPSATTQALLKEKTKKSDMEISFERNGIRMLVTLYNSLPDAVLINARNMNPKCAPLVRLIKSTARFANIPVGVFTTGDFIFKRGFMQDCGADAFITFNESTIKSEIEGLCAKKDGKLALPAENDIIKTGILEKIFSMIETLESIEKISKVFLNMLAEIEEIPACALFVNLKDGAQGFYIAGSNFTQGETEDFLRVCTNDFEDRFSELNLTHFAPKKLGSSGLERFHTEDIPLSAYHLVPLEESPGVSLATLHIVKEGSFTSRQLDLFAYAAEQLTLLLKIAILVYDKIKFERNIRKAFSRFVPEQIIEELVDDVEKEAKVDVGEKRDVAILFSDIRSFTSISECNKPETIVAFLNRYFTIMCTVIKKHGGTIDKFIGDAIMALFGAPVSYEDNARRAVAAACEMRTALESVPLGDLVLPPGMKFNIGIGIHYGDVIVGSIGSSDKTDYSVIGDSVNLASRMEGLTKTYGAMILATQAVKDDIKTDGFAFRYLDDVKVKGKEKAVPIYAVDKDDREFPPEYKDAYSKGLSLYKKGVWNLAWEYFEEALSYCENDKAAALMSNRCVEFKRNPPENWDGAIAFSTK